MSEPAAGEGAQARPVMVRTRCVRRGDTAWEAARLLDLSTTGARIVCAHTYPVDEQVELQLRMPVTDQVLLARARVTWMRPFDTGHAEHVVAFLAPSPEVEQALRAAVQHLSLTEPPPRRTT
jgi:hypothetical protein